MSRNLIITVAAILVIGGLIFALNRPEPTPEERLQEAVKETAESLKEARDAVSDAVTEASGSIAEEVNKAATDASESLKEATALMSEQIAASTKQTKDQLQALVKDWKDSGIITESGIDFDKAIQAVDASDMSDDGKARTKSILNALRDAPGAFGEKLAKLEEVLVN